MTAPQNAQNCKPGGCEDFEDEYMGCSAFVCGARTKAEVFVARHRQLCLRQLEHAELQAHALHEQGAQHGGFVQPGFELGEQLWRRRALYAMQGERRCYMGYCEGLRGCL